MEVAVVAPFDHAKVAPVVLDVAFKFKLVRTQFNTVSIPALMFGAVMFLVTITKVESTQPLIKLVITKVYLPG